MNQGSFVFAGNRANVLEVMFARNLNIIKIFAVQGSYLENYLMNNNIKYSKINGKIDFIKSLEDLDFDYFIGNGLPMILPISKLQLNNKKKFINIHPSFLPDLRGADPVLGALLYGRDSGATCHFMDDGIDTGAIISRINIDNTNDLEAGLLYQLSFIAEKEAFELAIDSNFIVDNAIQKHLSNNDIYYTFKDTDTTIDFSKDANEIIRVIRAFSLASKGARFVYKDKQFIVRDAELIHNHFLKKRIGVYKENQIILKYESKLIIKKGDSYIKLKDILGDLSLINLGDCLGS